VDVDVINPTDSTVVRKESATAADDSFCCSEGINLGQGINDSLISACVQTSVFTYTASTCTVVTDAANPDGSTYNLVNGGSATDNQCCGAYYGTGSEANDPTLLGACQTTETFAYTPIDEAAGVLTDLCEKTTIIYQTDGVT
jgi:hypothetical protein